MKTILNKISSILWGTSRESKRDPCSKAYSDGYCEGYREGCRQHRAADITSAHITCGNLEINIHPRGFGDTYILNGHELTHVIGFTLHKDYETDECTFNVSVLPLIGERNEKDHRLH